MAGASAECLVLSAAFEQIGRRHIEADKRMGIAGLAGARVRLMAIRGRNRGAIEAWYGEAARAAYEERSFQELLAAAGEGESLFGISLSGGNEPIGLLAWRRESKWLTMEFIAMAKAHRGWGYGSEAVRLLEEWVVREEAASRFRAEVDVRNGLALYFWLRLGYRPEATARGKLLMAREG